MTAIHEPDRGPAESFSPAPGVTVIPLLSPTLPPATRTNCVVLGGREGAVVIDPATPYEGERLRLRHALADHPIRAVWLTHHHGDHVGAARFVAESFDVPIAAHPRTRELLRDHVPTHDDLLDGDSFDCDAGTWEVLHTPGHAQGHLAFRDVARRTVVAGDLVAGQGTIVIDPPDGDLADYLTTLGTLVEQGAGTLIPAHGPALPDGESLLLSYIAHRLRREEQVLATLRARGGEGRPLDLVVAMYPEVPPMFHPLAARQVLAHLLKLEAEGRVDRPDGSTGVPGAPVYLRAPGTIPLPMPCFRLIR